MADLSAELFGPTATSTTRWPAAGASRTGGSEADEIVRKIRAEAVRLGLQDPDLAVAVAMKESALKPDAWGDRGASLGLFQLQRAAAIDAGIDPNRRQDVDLNIRGGVTYLKQKLDQSGGNVEQALRRYNSGTPTFKGLGDPRYVERTLDIRRDLEHPSAFSKYGAVASSPLTSVATRATRAVRGALSPASAEAAPVSPARPSPSPPGRGSQLFNELFGPAPGVGPVTPAPVAPAPVAPAPVAPAPVTPAPVAPGPTPGALGAPYGAAPPPRSHALAAEQQQAAQTPWWQRAARAAGAASPEIALMQPQLPQIEQARAEMSPAERQELLRQEGQSGTGADVGEIVGQMVGGAVFPGPGTAVGGTVGAVTGMTAETLATQGRLPTWKEVGREAVWSAIPEFLESGVRGLARTIGRGTQGGRLIRLDEAARRARQLPEVFNAQTRQEVGAAFDAVRASGVQLDVGPLRGEIQALQPGKYADVVTEMRRMDQAYKTGGRYQQLIKNLRQGGPTRVAGWPIGDLQQFRSALRQRVDQLEHTEARDLMRNVQVAVDQAIDAGIARGRVATGMTVDQLREARRQWARTIAAEDLGDLVERSTTVTPDLTMSSLNLRQLADALRKNTNPLAQRVNRALDQTPGARAAFQRELDDVAHLYQTVELPMSDVFGIWRAPGFAMVRQIISNTLLNPTGREAFRNAIVYGRGTLSLNSMTAAANAARRESGVKLPDLPGLEEEPGGLQEGRQIQVEPGRVSR